jgi:hypothetical protein
LLLPPKVATRRSSKIARSPLGLVDFACINEPWMWQEALKRKDTNNWKEVADEEYRTIMKNETWDFT